MAGKGAGRREYKADKRRSRRRARNTAAPAAPLGPPAHLSPGGRVVWKGCYLIGLLLVLIPVLWFLHAVWQDSIVRDFNELTTWLFGG
jgi:hypothetical protein